MSGINDAIEATKEAGRLIYRQMLRIEALESELTMLADTVEAQRTVIYRQKARIVYLESVVAALRKESTCEHVA